MAGKRAVKAQPVIKEPPQWSSKVFGNVTKQIKGIFKKPEAAADSVATAMPSRPRDKQSRPHPAHGTAPSCRHGISPAWSLLWSVQMREPVAVIPRRPVRRSKVSKVKQNDAANRTLSESKINAKAPSADMVAYANTMSLIYGVPQEQALAIVHDFLAGKPPPAKVVETVDIDGDVASPVSDVNNDDRRVELGNGTRTSASIQVTATKIPEVPEAGDNRFQEPVDGPKESSTHCDRAPTLINEEPTSGSEIHETSVDALIPVLQGDRRRRGHCHQESTDSSKTVVEQGIVPLTSETKVVDDAVLPSNTREVPGSNLIQEVFTSSAKFKKSFNAFAAQMDADRTHISALLQCFANAYSRKNLVSYLQQADFQVKLEAQKAKHEHDMAEQQQTHEKQMLADKQAFETALTDSREANRDLIHVNQAMAAKHREMIADVESFERLVRRDFADGYGIIERQGLENYALRDRIEDLEANVAHAWRIADGYLKANQDAEADSRRLYNHLDVLEDIVKQKEESEREHREEIAFAYEQNKNLNRENGSLMAEKEVLVKELGEAKVKSREECETSARRMFTLMNAVRDPAFPGHQALIEQIRGIQGTGNGADNGTALTAVPNEQSLMETLDVAAETQMKEARAMYETYVASGKGKAPSNPRGFPAVPAVSSSNNGSAQKAVAPLTGTLFTVPSNPPNFLPNAAPSTSRTQRNPRSSKPKPKPQASFTFWPQSQNSGIPSLASNTNYIPNSTFRPFGTPRGTSPSAFGSQGPSAPLVSGSSRSGQGSGRESKKTFSFEVPGSWKPC